MREPTGRNRSLGFEFGCFIVRILIHMRGREEEQ
jgi:hypothetical protein